MSGAPDNAEARPVIAVLLAGGTGTRLGAQLPKQLLKVAGREILAHTLDVFESCEAVDEIHLFMTPGHRGAAEQLVTGYGYRKVNRVLDGGATRPESARRALAALADHPGDSKVLLHDAVRPLIDADTITACVRALDECDALTVAVPSTDTILEVADGFITDIPDRSALWRCQTPQGFRLSVLGRAHALAAEDPEFTATDDCGVVRRYLRGVPIKIVPGGEHNLKITHSLDLRLAETLLSDRTL